MYDSDVRCLRYYHRQRPRLKDCYDFSNKVYTIPLPKATVPREKMTVPKMTVGYSKTVPGKAILLYVVLIAL